MSDVGKIGKEKMGPEPTGPKRKKKHDSEAFKEMMKVGKVRETDPEEKRKRKRQAEVEEEKKGEKPTAPKQGLEKKTSSILEPKTGKKAFGAKESEAKKPDDSLPAQGAAPPPYYQPPTEEEPTESGMPSKAPSEAPSEAPGEARRTTAAKQQPSQPRRKNTRKHPTAGKVEKKPPEPPISKPKEEIPSPIAKKTVKEEGKVSIEEAKKPAEVPLKKKKEKESTEEVTLPTGAWEASQALEKEEKKQAPLEAKTPAEEIFQPMALPSPAQAPSSPPVAAFTHLPPQISALFERMAGVMTVMTESGITETTINLNNPQFAHSVFYGAQIIISEFSTAPKAFNIELLGNQQATTLFANNTEELVAAFQAGNYTFKVNRIDTGYLPATSEVKRREARRVKRKKSGGA